MATMDLPIQLKHLNPDLPIMKYIPNLTVKPFQVTREYAQRIVCV